MYSYLPLKKREIRVLELQPSTSDHSGIQTDLRTVSLDDEPDFEALSYCWGDKSNPEEITLGTAKHQVTQNLFHAMNGFRSDSTTRVIWVDALCINQEDVEERSSQVALMGEIYKAASKVLVWLRSKDEREDPEFCDHIIRHSADQREHFAKFPWELLLNFNSGVPGAAWWRRVWTVQEAILARDLTFHVGRQSFFLEQLEGYEQALAIHFGQNKSCCGELTEESPFGRNSAWFACAVIKELLERRDEARHGGLNLLDLALSCHGRKATDPRDKILAFVGMLDAIPPGLVNYSLSQLEVLSHVFGPLPTPPKGELARTLSVREYRLSELPSWCPDWKQAIKNAHIPHMQRRINIQKNFNAAAGATADVTFPHENCLGLTGVECDKISHVAGKHFANEMTFNAEVLRSWCDLLATEYSRNVIAHDNDVGLARYLDQGFTSWDNIRTHAYLPKPAETLKQAFRATLTLDCTHKGITSHWKPATMIEQLAFLDYWTEVIEGEGEYSLTLPSRELMEAAEELTQNMHTQVEDHVHYCTDRRRFFMSEKGYIGLGPADARIGDVICVLRSGKIPFILRELEDAVLWVGTKGEKECTLVGDAYVHGLMDGEAMDLLAGDLLQEKHFILH